MTLSGFLAYAGALAIAAVTPGPQVFAIISQALRSGFRRAAWMAAGMVLGDLVYLTTVLAGFAILATTLSTFLIAVKWAGVAYLCWLAGQYWNSGTKLEEIELDRAGSERNAFIAGILVTLGNPKSVLFYISIMPSIVHLSSITKTDVLILLAITGTILMAAQFPLALAAARSRHMIYSPRRLRLVNRGASICMGGAAVTIALRK